MYMYNTSKIFLLCVQQRPSNDHNTKTQKGKIMMLPLTLAKININLTINLIFIINHYHSSIPFTNDSRLLDKTPKWSYKAGGQ